MTEADEPPEAISKAEAMAMAEEAEAEAAEAEALAAAARARARAARLRREALALAEAAEDYGDAAAAAADVAALEEDYEDYGDYGEDSEEADAADYDEDYADSADEEATDAAASEPARGSTGRRGRMPSMAATSNVAAAILVICFAGASVYMALQHRDKVGQHERQAAFVAGAKQGVTNMISLDYSKAKEDVQRVVDSATGEFKEDFQNRSKDFISVVEQSKAVTEGTVNGTAVQSMNGNSAVVLVAATSRVTNSPGGKEQPPRIWRLKVTVADVGGQYKMSKVEYIP